MGGVDSGRLSVPRPCVGAILAGGASTRMAGAPKGLEPVGGSRIIDRVSRSLRASADSVVLIANDVAAAEWIPGMTVIRDRRPGLGAMSGLHAGLAATGADLLAVAWDMPFVPVAILRALREAGETTDAEIAVPRSNSPWGFEPLVAWFRDRALAPVDLMIDAGDGRVGALAGHAKLLTVDVSSWGDPDEIFFSVNTPDDLVIANRIAARISAPPAAQ